MMVTGCPKTFASLVRMCTTLRGQWHGKYIYICMIFNGVHQATYTLWEGSTSTKWDLIGVVPSESGPSLPYLVISGVIGLIAYLLPGVNH